MKNYFIVHGSFGDSKEHHMPWLEKEFEKLLNLIKIIYKGANDGRQ